MRGLVMVPMLVLLGAPLALAQTADPPPHGKTSPAAADQDGTEPAGPDQAGAKPLPPATPQPPQPSWQAHRMATLQVLDKVNGQSATLVIPVDAQQDYRALTIAVRACFARPPDQAADATALLLITGKGTAAPLYSGWMLAAEPAAAMMQDAVYDVRVLGCQ